MSYHAQPLHKITFLRHSLVMLVSNVGMTLLGLLTGVLVARLLGPSGRGLMTPLLLWPMMLAWAGGLSLSYANVYFGAADPRLLPRLFANSFWTALALGSALAVGAVVVLPHCIPLTTLQNHLLIIGLCLVPLGIWADQTSSFLQALGRFDRFGLVRCVAPMLTAAMLLLLWGTHHLDWGTAVVATWVGSLSSISLTTWYLVRGGHASLRPDFQLLRRCLAYSTRIHPGTLINLANGRLDQLLMTALVAPKALGLYAFAVTLSELLNQIASAVSIVLLPKMAANTNETSRLAVAVQSARWVLIISSIGAGGLYFAAPILVSLLWGSRFAEAVPVARILLPGTVALSLAVTLSTCLRGAGKPLAGTVAELGSLMVMIPLLVFLLPRFGIYGAGVASTCGYIVNCLVAAVYFAYVFGGKSLLAICPTRRDWDDGCRMLAYALRRRIQVTPANL